MSIRETKKQSVTLSDVAEAAAVSVVTASRAMRTPELVSQATRDRVDAAVRALGYVPNPAAQALASARSRIIGVVIPSVTNQVFADLLRGVIDASDGTAYAPQFVNTRFHGAREEDLLRVLATQRPAGMIVTGVDQTDASRTILADMGCPVVQVMETGPDPVDMMVGCDQFAAGRAAVRHLLDQGYRRVAFLGARMDPRAQRRFAGYRAVMEAEGLDDPVLAVTTAEPSSYSVGGRLMADLLSAAPDADAVFCNNDDVALGALFECQRRGIRVPSAMGIVGFNDLDISACSVPTITSVRTHRYDMGHRAVELIVAALEDDRPADPVIDLGFTLMERQSSRRLEGKTT
jgi:LacI family gluconate utilization system Gnt-I transcriptional repressor